MTIPERPQRRTGWTILIVPPNPLRSTRALYVRHRHVRAVLTVLALGAFTVLGLGTMVASDSLQATAAEEQLADANRVILSLTDSLRWMTDGGVVQAGSPGGAPEGRGVRARPVGLAVPAPGIVLPVQGIITSRFTRARFHPLLRIFRPHKGVDVYAVKGTPILAPAAGRVVFAGRSFGNGNMVELDHGGGVHSRYAHCSVIKVREGDFVSYGDVIGLVGSTGLSTGPHLHFEVRINGTAVDPLRTVITPRIGPSFASPAMPAAARAPSRPVVDPDGGSGDDGFPDTPVKDSAAHTEPPTKRGEAAPSPAPAIVPSAPAPALTPAPVAAPLPAPTAPR